MSAVGPIRIGASIAAAVLTLAAGGTLPAAASTGATGADRTETPAPGQVDDEPGRDDEIPVDAGRIIGSPDAGPDPRQSGDRGGWAQLLTLGVLVVGVGFILLRILRAARRAPGSSPTET